MGHAGYAERGASYLIATSPREENEYWRRYQHTGAAFVRDAGGGGQGGTASAAQPGGTIRTNPISLDPLNLTIRRHRQRQLQGRLVRTSALSVASRRK